MLAVGRPCLAWAVVVWVIVGLSAWRRAMYSVLDTVRAVYGGVVVCESVEIDESM